MCERDWASIPLQKITLPAMKNSVAHLAPAPVTTTVYPILFAVSFVHLLNDAIQSVIPAMYPVLKNSMNLSFTQVGLITLASNLTASLLQPLIGLYTDIKPKPYSLPIGMGFTLTGVLLLAMAPSFVLILVSVGLVGIGSAVLHPEASRVAYLASGGGRRGLAQSIFQLGGNTGSAIGPLLAALFIAPLGQSGLKWVSLAAMAAIIVQLNISKWYSKHHLSGKHKRRTGSPEDVRPLPRRQVRFALLILVLLIFSKYIYLSGITSYFTFYLIDQFGVTVRQSQMYLFLFLASAAAGTFMGGPLGDRFSRKYVIWFSILGTAPFSLMLPHADLFWSGVLCVLIGFILSSAFSVILVYAQELMPGRVGMVSGLFFGLAFGMGGIGSALLGYLADQMSMETVFKVCAFLPLMGLITAFLPDLKKQPG